MVTPGERSQKGRSGRSRFNPSPAAAVALVGTISLALACLVALLMGLLTITSLITPGGLGPSASLVAADFGPDALRPDHTGYDGQQVYAIAREFPDLREASAHLDAPAYRLLRILPPALASVAPNGAPTVVALLVVNILGFGIAVYAGGRLLGRVGVRPFYALPAASVLLLGVASSGVEPLAWGLTLLGLHLAMESRHRAAVCMLVLAALSRETAGVAAAVIGAGLWAQGTALRHAVGYLLPGGIVALWFVVVRRIVGESLPARFDLFGFTDLPLFHAIIAASVAGLGAWTVVAWRDQPPVALCGLGFTAWMLVYRVEVLDPIALLRVNGLPIALGILGLARTAENVRARGSLGEA